jgi:hypothetical protein
MGHFPLVYCSKKYRMGKPVFEGAWELSSSHPQRFPGLDGRGEAREIFPVNLNAWHYNFLVTAEARFPWAQRRSERPTCIALRASFDAWGQHVPERLRELPVSVWLGYDPAETV